MYRSSAAGNKNRFFTATIAVLCLTLSYTQAAINNSNNNGNSARPNGQYSSYQQNDAAAAAVPTTTYFTNNQNQYVHNNQQQQPHYQHHQQQQQQQSQQPHQQDIEKEKDVLERFHHRFPDGSYEFRYELADGTARYERGYFLIYDKIKTLVVVGYYSYRQTDGRYITVFYNADQNGYRQNQSITPQVYPNLPRSIEVPQFKESIDYATERPNKGRQ